MHQCRKRSAMAAHQEHVWQHNPPTCVPPYSQIGRGDWRQRHNSHSYWSFDTSVIRPSSLYCPYSAPGAPGRRHSASVFVLSRAFRCKSAANVALKFNIRRWLSETGRSEPLRAVGCGQICSSAT